MEDLFEMLRYRRQHKSRTESKFINRFLRPIGVETDEVGNLWKIVGDKPTILWSAHTDSVHRQEGKQKLIVDISKQIVRLSGFERQSNCLGADNAAGVWMLLEMIKAGVPGLYVFHRGEECGGVGSKHFAKNTELLSTIQAAIAFDRRRKHSIITHQWGGRCCSDTFGRSLAAVLDLGHTLDSGGLFTDTANYTHIVPECTNVSVGFEGEHSSLEILDLGYLAQLRDAVLHADWSQLAIERTPSEEFEWDDASYGIGYERFGGYGQHHRVTTWKYDWDDDQGYTPARDRQVDTQRRATRPIMRMITDYPDVVADWIEQRGLEDDLSDYIDQVEFSDWDNYVDKKYAQ